MSRKLTAIHSLSQEMGQKVREFVLSQKLLWRKVPWLALQADGRGGYSEAYQRTYYQGIWTVPMPTEHGYHGTFVDCFGGRIVRVDEKDRYIEQSNRSLALLGVCGIGGIDARRVISELQKQTSTGDFSGHTVQELKKRETWRLDIIQKLSLKPSYTGRKKNIED